MRITDTFEREKLVTGISAGAATVGKPKGLNGKNIAPRRAIYTKKEKESIDKRAGLRAGGPGSGRKSSMGLTIAQHESKIRELQRQKAQEDSLRKTEAMDREMHNHQKGIDEIKLAERLNPDE